MEVLVGDKELQELESLDQIGLARSIGALHGGLFQQGCSTVSINMTCEVFPLGIGKHIKHRLVVEREEVLHYQS